MFAYIWPVLLVIAANVLYNFCARETPREVNALASLLLTYLIAALVTFLLYCATAGPRHLPDDLRAVNWTTFALGIAILGIETGYIFMYRAGWAINSASLTANISLALVLFIVGLLFYHEQITLDKAIGMGFCLAGLYFLNR
ncbi:MAG: EamA family transporter [Desulfovibrionaceae bacterium]